MTSASGKRRKTGVLAAYRSAFTLIELLVVVTIIAFVAAALVVSARKVMERAQRAKTSALIQGLTTACAMFKDDFGYYPPDDWPTNAWTWSATVTSTVATRGTAVSVDPSPATVYYAGPIANCMLRLLYWNPPKQKQYYSAKESDLRGGWTGSLASQGFPYYKAGDPLVLVDAWGRAIYYDCHTSDPGPPGNLAPRPDQRIAVRCALNGALYTPPVHNAKGADIFSTGQDGRTACDNRLDDNQNGVVDTADSAEISSLIGEAEDDIANWIPR